MFGFRFTDNLVENGAGTLVSCVGKFIALYIRENVVAELVKFIPVIGSVAGGVTNAVVAGGITYGIGVATVKKLEKVYRNILDGKNVEEFDIASLFKNDEFRETVSECIAKYTKNKKELKA